VPRRKRRFRKTPQPNTHLVAPSFVLRYAGLKIHEIKILIIGPDSAGNLLEVIGLEIDNQSLLIIHAMKIRKSVMNLLEGRS